MFSKFWKDKQQDQSDPKQLRAAILDFVKSEILPLEGGEGRHMQLLKLFLFPQAEDRFLYESAVQAADPSLFKEEVQRIADNYAVDLPLDWQLEVHFTADLPSGSKKSPLMPVSLEFGSVPVPEVLKTEKTILKILAGKAIQESYIILPGSRINLGREERVQLRDNSIRINDIAFPAELQEGNKYISRQHAHLEWDEPSRTFRLFADEGGVPPGNKTKIRSAADESLHKLNSIQVGYTLKPGDQVILGDQIVISFNSWTEKSSV